MCPNAEDSETQTNIWQSIYAPPITRRLNAAAWGANLTDTDIFNLISLCPFETVAKTTRSPFCNLFTRAEFQAYEYHGDLNKYFHTGYAYAYAIHYLYSSLFTATDKRSGVSKALGM